MDGIKIEVTGNVAKVVVRPSRLTAGTVGLPVEFSFDSQWEGLIKTAVFRAGNVSKNRENLVTKTTVPWEVLEKHGLALEIGVYGVNTDGTVAIPTIWANVGVIRDGVSISKDMSIDSTLPVWKQISNAIGNLPGLTTTSKGNIVEAINELHSIVLAALAEASSVEGGDATGDETEPAESIIKAHADDKNNPHNVTASQVGARPDTWMPTAEDVGARPATWMPTAEELGALSSKWITKDAAANGTLADALTISAESADGENNIPKLVDETTIGMPFNCQLGIRTVEWYSASKAFCRILGVDTTGMPAMWLCQRDTSGDAWTGWLQTDMVTEIDAYPGCYFRQRPNGEMEWLNPPMYPNVEYRTTERWNGKPVYCKVIEIGTADIPASSGSKRVEIGVEHTNVVRYHCFASYSTNIIGLPYADSSGDSLTVRILGTGVFFNASSDAFSGYTATLTLYYVK